MAAMKEQNIRSQQGQAIRPLRERRKREEKIMATELTTSHLLGSAADRKPPPMPATTGEVTNTLNHYYRGELGRMTSWRDRIDRTSNWAITVVAALLSVSLSTPTSHHGVLLFGMMLITLLLTIEARRYRFFDVYRARIRQLERSYFAQILAPEADLNPDWAVSIAKSLRAPRFLLNYFEAMQRRLRRNYCWMYAILLLAWILKISTPKLQTEGVPQELAQSWSYIVDNAALGPIPGWPVIAMVAAFYAVILYGTLRRGPDDGDFTHGEAHV
ncbi:putative membrane protein [Rhizobium sp. BK602]|nr:putative membrane protein [Rhizobium sp. BK602]